MLVIFSSSQDSKIFSRISPRFALMALHISHWKYVSGSLNLHGFWGRRARNRRDRGMLDPSPAQIGVSLSGKKKLVPGVEQPDRPESASVKAYTQVAAEKGNRWVTTTDLGGGLQQFDPTFKAKVHGSPTLRRLLQKQDFLFEGQETGGWQAVRNQQRKLQREKRGMARKTTKIYQSCIA